MTVEWDEQKAASNLLKHGVAFADAVGAFEDPNALTRDDTNDDEERYVTLGMDFVGRVLVVVYTYRGEAIRIISARNATRAERRQYTEDL